MGLIGAKAHVARLRKLSGPAMTREVGKALAAAGKIVKADAQHSITTGAVSGKNHVASKPGEAPNADTHFLDLSIESAQISPLVVEVSANAPYAAALEGGSKIEKGKLAARTFAGKKTEYGPQKVKQGPVRMEYGGSETPARPFMRPARDRTKKEVIELVTQAVSRVVRQSRSREK